MYSIYAEKDWGPLLSFCTFSSRHFSIVLSHLGLVKDVIITGIERHILIIFAGFSFLAFDRMKCMLPWLDARGRLSLAGKIAHALALIFVQDFFKLKFVVVWRIFV